MLSEHRQTCSMTHPCEVSPPVLALDPVPLAVVEGPVLAAEL